MQDSKSQSPWYLGPRRAWLRDTMVAVAAGAGLLASPPVTGLAMSTPWKAGLTLVGHLISQFHPTTLLGSNWPNFL